MKRFIRDQIGDWRWFCCGVVCGSLGMSVAQSGWPALGVALGIFAGGMFETARIASISADIQREVQAIEKNADRVFDIAGGDAK